MGFNGDFVGFHEVSWGFHDFNVIELKEALVRYNCLCHRDGRGMRYHVLIHLFFFGTV